MGGLNAALSLAARSLDVFTAGIQVAGNNISNATTPGYIREQLNLTSAFPSKEGVLIFGNGVSANGIRQQIDKFLEQRVYTANADAQGAQTSSDIYTQLQQSVGALGDSSLSTQLNNFLGKLNDLVNLPEDPASRQLAVQQGAAFATSVTALRTQIDTLRTSINGQVKDQVAQANKLIDDIAALNPKITALESAGLSQSDAGDLRTQRYNDLTALSKIIPINVVEQPTGAVNVFTGSDFLVIPGTTQHLQTVAAADRGLAVLNVRVEGSNNPLSGTQGSLNGLTNGRDATLGGFEDQLDTFTSSVIYQFNKIHSSGQGLHGYTSTTGTYQVADPNAALNAAGLPFPPENGSFQVKVINKVTGLATTSTINVSLDGTQPGTTLNDIVTQLNGVTNVTASVTGDRKLQLNAGSGYEIEFQNDTSGALASLGINTFFTGSNSTNIAVNSQISTDPTLFAASNGGGPGDGSNAAKLAALTDSPVSSLGGLQISQYYDTTISSMSQSASSQSAVASGTEGYVNSLMNQRQQTTGVSLDEEAITMMQFQRSYQITAKFISTIDDLMTKLTQL